MIKRFFLPLLILMVLLVSACQPATPQATASAPSPTPLPPTDTAVPPSPTEAPTPTLAVAAAPAPLPLADIELFADGAGWGASQSGSRVFHTTDGAATWQEVSPGPAEGDLAFHFFLDASTTWALFSQIETSAVLFRTTDAGATWAEVSLDFPGGAMYFLDADNGFLLSDLGVGAGSNYVALYHTQDGGQTWEQRFAHTPGSADTSLPAGGIKNGLSFLDNNIGWVTGSTPISSSLYLYETNNAGTSWNRQDCSGLPAWTGEAFFEPQPVITLSNGKALLPIRAMTGADVMQTWFCLSEDQGQSWQFLSQLDAPTRQTSTAPDLSALAFGEDRLFSSADGGQTWQDISASLPAGVTVLDAESVDANTGYLVVMNASSVEIDQNLLYRTTDGGQTWSVVPAVIDGAS